MANIVINRCPVCPTIAGKAGEIAAALKTDLGLDARTVDGQQGELSVYVGGVPVIQRTGDSLPSTDEVEAAVRNALPLPV